MSQTKIGWRSGTSSQTTTQIVTTGLIMNLDASNASSYSGTGTTWTDLSGSNNGTLVNGVGYSSADGGSLVFDGVNDWVENLSSTLLNNLSKFTLNTWFKVNNTSLNNSIFSFNWNSAGLVDILLGVYGNYLFCQVDNGQDGGGYIQNFTSTSWNNVQVVFDGTLSGNSNRLKIYLNGVLLTLQYDSYTVPATTANNASRFALGAYINGNFNNRLFGNIANCLIYNTALSASEVTQNFNATKARFGFPTLDTDAQAFITAATITELNQQSAVNTLVTDLKSANIWTKMKAIYPFVGGTATSHKFNLKDPRDLDAAFRLQFNGGWTHTSTGATPNGTTGYANTYLNPYVVFGNNQGFFPANSTHQLVHVSKYSRTNSIPSNGYDGVYSDGGNQARYMFFGWSSAYGSPNGYAALNGWGFTNPYSSVSLGNRTDGFFVVNRDGYNSLKSFRNNTLISSNTTDIRSYNETGLQLNLNPNQVFFIGARNDSYDYNLRAFAYNSFETSFQSIGWSLTDAEATAFYNAVQAFQTTLGRAV